MIPSKNLIRTIMAMESGLPLPVDVNRWLLNGLRKHRDGAPLEVSLGLKLKPGGAYDKPETASRYDSRDAAIRALQYWLYRDITAWEAAGEILSLVNTPNAYAKYSESHPARHLLKKLKGAPTSQKQILRILKGDRSC